MKKVLIVDDSQAQVALTKSLLDSAGYWTVALTDPKRIEQTIDVERPQLILLDVVMPERNGFQVCRELKSSALYGRIPVVLVTSRDQSSDKFWGEQQGADGYIVKPFTGPQLLSTVGKFF